MARRCVPSGFIRNFDVAGGETNPAPPDLVLEIVVSHPAGDALADCAILGVPEVWVWDVPRTTLTFYRLVTRGKDRGRYVPSARSRALPMLHVDDVFDRLLDPTSDAGRFDRDCREWATHVLPPRRGDREDRKGRRRLRVL